MGHTYEKRKLDRQTKVLIDFTQVNTGKPSAK